MAEPSASMDVPLQQPPSSHGNAPKARADGAPGPAGKAGHRELEKELSRVDGKKWLRRLGFFAAFAALVAGGAVWRAKTAPKPPAKYVVAATSKGEVAETVQSTGQVQPLTQIQVGAQVSGRITKVFVDFNSKVKSGEVLAEIDPTLFGAAIDQTRAQVDSAQAQVVHAEATVATAKQRLDRARKLVAEGIGSQSDLETAQGTYDVAIADLAAAKASVIQSGAALRSSRTNMEYTRIYSPIDGVVITRSIDPGQTVAASFQAPVLFVIAQDLRKMRVLADVDEADVGKLKESMSAEVRVDAFPGEKFKGIVSQVRYSPNTNSGVVTYSAVIDVDNPDVKLRPGMTATVSIRTAEAKDVTRVPNASLRFKPSPPLDKDGKKIPQDPLPALAAGKGRIYLLTDDKPGAEKAEMREVDIGITDGINTVLKTDLGDSKLVVDENDDPSKKKGPF
jgi:HlyD family secretion protein